MKVFSISGRCIAMPPPPDWRMHLIQMLGTKPRRIGTWAELGLYGALRCMADAGEAELPEDAILMLASRHGTYAATDLVLEQIREDLPMPFAFLQTLPSQLLALLAAQMQWKGHACFFACTELYALLRLAAAQSGRGGVLLGWVDEMDGGSSNWLRLRCEDEPADNFSPARTADDIFSSEISHIYISQATLLLRSNCLNNIGMQREKC